MLVGAIVYVWLKDLYINEIEKSLLENINIVSLHVKEGINLDKLASQIKQNSGIRLTIVAEDGKVLAESHKDKTTMDNHKYREEIMEARTEDFGQSIRHSATLNKKLLYVAKKFGHIYIRMAKKVDTINEKLFSLALQVGIVSILFFAIAFFIAYKTSIQLEKETNKLLKFLLTMTKKQKGSFVNSDFSLEFFQITKLLTKISRVLIKKDKQKAKYTAKLQKANSQKEDIISAISHEFKNPIAVINGYSQTLLTDKNINEKIREKFLSKIHSNGEKLSLLIDKLRFSVRLDEKKLMPSMSQTNISDLVLQNIDDIKQNFKNRNIILKSEKVSLKVDPTLMEVAITNLIENALKYSEDDVFVTITQNSISIEDTGIGINRYELEKITDKFYRVSNNTWNNSLGLGLSIVSNIVKLHHFDLDIKSKENSGSTFSIVWA